MIKDTIFCCGERNNKPATNRMADIAAIFGLKFGEKFKLKEYGHIVEVPNYDGGRDEVSKAARDAHEEGRLIVEAEKKAARKKGRKR